MSSKAPDSGEIGRELKSILDYVQDCERRVHRGEIMDLQGLDRKVIVLCETIARMPQNAAQELESQMSQLIQNLEKLAEAMRAQQTKITAGGAR